MFFVITHPLRHSRVGGNPEFNALTLDPLLQGDDNEIYLHKYKVYDNIQ
jgi:hypothetical protein